MDAIRVPTVPAPPTGQSHPSVGDAAIQTSLLAAIVESSDDAIVSKTLDGRIRTWNGGAERIFGYLADEIIGQPITLIIPEELRGEEADFIEKLKRGERIDHFDTVRVAKDGRRIHVSLTISPVRDSHGAIVGASKVARDISERMLSERLRREQEDEIAAEASALAKLNDFSTRLWQCRSLDAGLCEILDSVMDLAHSSKAMLELREEGAASLSLGAQRGFEGAALVALRAVTAADDGAWGDSSHAGKRLVIRDVEAAALGRPLRERASAAGVRGLIALPLLRVDGGILAVLWVYFAQPYEPTAQELRRLELFARQANDFIQRCAMEQALHEREDALRDADRRKDEFLALLAHELRNPLAPIRYALAASKKAGRSAEQQRRGEEVIERQVAHMSRLLDDLLEVSRITRGTLDLRKTRTDLTAILGTAIESARPAFDAKQHELSVDLPRSAITIDADPVRLAQVFSNLLINAAKYTDPGGRVELRVTKRGGEIEVSVRDNGIGISAETLPRLFTLFAQAQPALARSEGGLGVGLALVRGLVLLHGGRVEARSAGTGQGSEFVVYLPLAAASPQAADRAERPIDAASAAALKILVVDDSRDAADMCATLLQLSGHDVRRAYSGRQALSSADEFRPDAVLLDIGLPDLNGYEVAKAIRGTPWGHSATLIAITGWGQTEDRRRAFDAGFDHHLTKPVAPESVLSMLRSPLKPAASASA